MKRIGIVDLGSNTARLAVFETEPGERFQLIDGIREPIRLGEGLAASGALSRRAMDRAQAAVHLFSDYAAATGLGEMEVIGTSALRDASNGDELLARLEPLGLEITVLSGEEEAQLGVLAVANSFALEEAWVVDLGGGSAQVSRMSQRRWIEGHAHPLGAVRLTEAFLHNDPPTPSEVAALERHVEGVLAEVADRIRRDGLPLVGIGGTLRNLSRATQEALEDPLGLLHGYSYQCAALEQLTEELLSLPARKRARIPGLNPDRADIIIAGALVFRWLARRAELDRILVSGHGVREGAFFRRFLPPPHLLPDVRRFSVANLLAQYGQEDHPHVERVVHLALQLFSELEPLHGLGEEEAGLLEAAAWLHDIGMTVDYHRHHKHGEYLVRSAPLPGFTQREMALISLLVRYHRKGLPKVGDLRPMLESDDKRRLLQLTSCLRLAEYLERSRAGRVKGVRATIGRKNVALEVRATETPTVELWEAAKQRDLFERAFGRSLSLTAVVDG
jgi:exopolyphosphatase / guanosine-5'-triphosphate,3'-diphosphate pyrophosphatase